MGCICSTSAANDSVSIAPSRQKDDDDNNLLRHGAAGRKKDYAKRAANLAGNGGASSPSGDPKGGAVGASSATNDSDVIVLATGRPFSPIFALNPALAPGSSANGGVTSPTTYGAVPNTSTSDDPPTSTHHLSGASAGAATDGLISPRGQRKILIRRLASPGPSTTLSRPSGDSPALNSPGVSPHGPGTAAQPSFGVLGTPSSSYLSRPAAPSHPATTNDRSPTPHDHQGAPASPHVAVSPPATVAAAVPERPSHGGPLYGGSVHPVSNFSTYSTVTGADAATMAGTGGGAASHTTSMSPVTSTFVKHSSPHCAYVTGGIGIPIGGGSPPLQPAAPAPRSGSSAGSAGLGAFSDRASKSRSPVRLPGRPVTPTI
jgi:hypothetical protein